MSVCQHVSRRPNARHSVLQLPCKQYICISSNGVLVRTPLELPCLICVVCMHVEGTAGQDTDASVLTCVGRIHVV